MILLIHDLNLVGILGRDFTPESSRGFGIACHILACVPLKCGEVKF